MTNKEEEVMDPLDILIKRESCGKLRLKVRRDRKLMVRKTNDNQVKFKSLYPGETEMIRRLMSGPRTISSLKEKKDIVSIPTRVSRSRQERNRAIGGVYRFINGSYTKVASLL